MPLSRVFGRYGVSCELVDVPIRSLSRYKRKRFYAVKSREIACRKRQPGAFAGVARTHSPGRGRRPQEDPCHGRVSPVCRFRSEDGAVPMSRVLGRRWAVCGAAAVWDSHDEMILAIQSIQFQKKNASGSPVWGPLEAFDFRTRIKDRRR